MVPARRRYYRSMMMSSTTQPVGDLLRDWRQRRRLSQLDLASEADVSTRHLSFLETGRAKPSREMVLRLADRLNVPMRDQNAMLLAAGFAPIYRERPLDDPDLRAARDAVDLVLTGHEPYPAIAIDRHWTMIAANRGVPPLLGGIEAVLLQPPINVLRLSLHPEGLAPRIANFTQWRTHLLDRLRRQVEGGADPTLAALLDELKRYPSHGAADGPARADAVAGVVVPLRLQTDLGLLTFFSTTTIFGTPVDITLSELAIESFFPANPETADRLRQAIESPPSEASDTTQP